MKKKKKRSGRRQEHGTTDMPVGKKSDISVIARCVYGTKRVITLKEKGGCRKKGEAVF